MRKDSSQNGPKDLNDSASDLRFVWIEKVLQTCLRKLSWWDLLPYNTLPEPKHSGHLCVPKLKSRTLHAFYMLAHIIWWIQFSRSKAQSVLVTFAITAGIVLMLTLFACQTKYDFTGVAVT